MVKEGAAVIDVGINRIQDPRTGKVRLIGDVDFDGKRAEVAGAISVTLVAISLKWSTGGGVLGGLE